MKEKKIFICNNCGYETPKWLGKCPMCQEFGTISEQIISSKNLTNKNTTSKDLKQMKDVNCKKNQRIITGINEFDRVMGGGIVNDSISILSAPPGAGKSTLCITLCDKLLQLGFNVLYASGEESETQIKNRAIRLQLQNIDDLWITNDTNLDNIVDIIKNQNIDFIVIDSIQTFYLNEFLPSRAGNPTQVIECASVLRDLAKDITHPRAIMLIGQMTKEDELAGSRALEHLVDTYIQIDGTNDDSLRTLFAKKNRFGNTGEMGFFSMEETGLISIDNPSEYFMTERIEDVIGSTLTVVKEGSRPIIAEIESLVSQSYSPYPARIGEALRKEQLNILVSILEQRGKINLFDKNVVIKTTGGIKLKEQNSNLAILMSIASSYYEIPIPNDNVFIADVGLTGELKKVPNLEMRIKELDRMNYKKVFIAPNSFIKNKTFNNLQVIECKTLLDVINNVFGSNVRRKPHKTKQVTQQKES